MIVTPLVKPTSALLSLQEAKEYLRVDHNLEDALILGAIDAAQAYLEGPTGILGRTLLEQTWTGRIDPWSEVGPTLEIPLPPLISIGEVRFIDGAGGSQVWAASDYRIQRFGDQPARLLPPFGGGWPSAGDFGIAEIDFTAGYGGPELLPDNIRTAALMIVADLYDNRAAAADRETYENRTVSRLLFPLKVWYV
jgi:uncharacterized phiE125 gp8 family phage protein